MLNNGVSPYVLVRNGGANESTKWLELFDTWASRAQANPNWNFTESTEAGRIVWQARVTCELHFQIRYHCSNSLAVNGNPVNGIVGTGGSRQQASNSAVQQMEARGDVFVSYF